MFSQIQGTYLPIIEKRIKEIFEYDFHADPLIIKAMQYSVNAGGKRLRPILNILANKLLDGNLNETLDTACSLEFIHTYSLIHDDLPAMDDDDLRRGKPTNHIVFGEAIGILSGDALLTLAFEVLTANAIKYKENVFAHLKAQKIIAFAAGIEGMISGQVKDIENEGQILSADELEEIHNMKTGALIKASLLSGLILCNPNDEQINALSVYGDNLGLAFQITDDILDITGDIDKLGKTVGKDSRSKKFTYPTLYGLERSKEITRQKINEAISALDIFGENALPLKELAQSIAERDK